MRLKPSLPIVSFESARDWGKWLAKHHARASGVWLRISKKGSSKASVTYAEALDEALCCGWIDSQKQAYDKSSWLQKFGPRKIASGWSKINTGHAERLRKAGRMKPAGLKEIQAAKRDGRWDAAYDSAGKSVVPSDLQSALDGNARAKVFFGTLDSRNRYAVVFRIQIAKTATTRAKQISKFVQMLERHEKVHP